MMAIFITAIIGGLAIDLVELSKCYNTKKIKFPEKYKIWHYYLVRLFISGMGGCLVVAYEIDSMALALHIGASTPIILENLTKSLAIIDR